MTDFILTLMAWWVYGLCSLVYATAFVYVVVAMGTHAFYRARRDVQVESTRGATENFKKGKTNGDQA